jgi:hypothetical protein
MAQIGLLVNFHKGQNMITKTRSPYEFLVRWTDGKISGAHIKFLDSVIEDGTVLNVEEGLAQPVSMAGEVGYPIADIWAAITASAISTGQQALTDMATADTKKADAEAAKLASEAAQAAAKLAVDACEAETTRLKAAQEAQAAAEKAAADKAAFDAAVAAAVAAQVAA